VDFLHLDAVAFPVLRGSLSRLNEAGDYSWCIEVHCGESEQLDYRNWPENKIGSGLDWLAGKEPYLYAQLLPLGVGSPDELIGCRYSFPQSSYDDPADWEPNHWPFFCLYTWEHDYVHPISLAFTAKRGRQYRAEIEGKFPVNNRYHDLRVQAWLDWDR